MKVLLDSNAIKNIKMFQTLTPAYVIDCAENEDTIYFVIKSSRINIDNKKVRNIERLFRKRLRIIRFSKNLETFVKELVPEAINIIRDGDKIKLTVRKYDRPRVVGKNKKNLIIVERFLKRFFDISEVKINW
ncbi:MAG: hypothetical protein QXQ40_00670 [Candidatus Aenigmatarchaeota archaeon]